MKFRGSLGARMVLVFGLLVASIGAFVMVFFPAHMADQAYEQAEDRARAIAHVMSSAVAPALEFDDEENATQTLSWLASTRDAHFGEVLNERGERFAVWQDAPELPADLIMITVPVNGIGGGRGLLRIGFGREVLIAEHEQARDTVAYATSAVLGVGLLATLALAVLLVRPIRKLTRTARLIADGVLPPELPTVKGGDEVTELADALRAMLDKIHSRSQEELVRASRTAGMAEVATGVLHNVGNVLTSVNISLELLRERTAAMPVERLKRLHDLLGQATVLEGDKLSAAKRYVGAVSDAFETYRGTAARDVVTLAGHVEHIKRVVAMQNAYARAKSVVEPTRIGTLLDEALELGCPSTKRGSITLNRTCTWELETALLGIDRHRVLQILVNLISNARDAVSARERREITLAARRDGKSLVLEVSDSGVGIAPELLSKIFSAGYTSKANGHGYGLHSSAIAATALGGELEVASEGTGMGATFTLMVPVEEVVS
jgi:signal transduction histidine kinase